VDLRQEEMKGQMGSLASWIDVNAFLENTQANPEEKEAVAEQQECLKKRLQWKLLEHWRTNMGTGI
jgi:hypothetical protein